MSQEDQKELNISDPAVVEKYKQAAAIANHAISLVVKGAVPGARIADLCAAADKLINDEAAAINKKNKEMKKGIAFPTCISPNQLVGHFSPSATEAFELKEGDIIKIDCGAHIDGFIAVAANTVIVGSDVVKGRPADALLAAHFSAEAALRLLKPGNKNQQVSEAFRDVCKDFAVTCVQGVLSHQMDRFNIDGEKTILNRLDPEHKVDDCEFQVGDVWSVDIVISTGDGKPRETGDERTNIFKRNADQRYDLKIKTSRTVFADVSTRFPYFPFHIRELDAKSARLGIKECLQHGLLNPYPVLQEKEGETVVHYKFTVLITSNGPVRISGLPIDVSKVQASQSLQNASIKQLLSQPILLKKK